jgi:Helix-turn-helix domain
MARAIDRRQVEQWLAEGLSLRAIAQRLGLPTTTFWRQWQRLQREAAAPVPGAVTEMPARPSPPARPPEGPPARVEPRPPDVHPGLPAELQALLPDLLALVAWWRERQHQQAIYLPGHPRATQRYTMHLETQWIEALKAQAAAEGISISALANRVFQAYFARR